jgi:hypothetical protein
LTDRAQIEINQHLDEKIQIVLEENEKLIRLNQEKDSRIKQWEEHHYYITKEIDEVKRAFEHYKNVKEDFGK